VFPPVFLLVLILRYYTNPVEKRKAAIYCPLKNPVNNNQAAYGSDLRGFKFAI
jgi:hypothetical protein